MWSEPRLVIERLCAERGEDFAGLSRMLGRNPAYIQQFVRRGVPKRLKEAKLGAADEALLFAYYLEGLGDGAWVFEAVQRVLAGNHLNRASQQWLDAYRTH